VQFIDEVVIYIRTGKGGDGHVSFRREKYVPHGGPDGGDGGRGGNVVFEAVSRKNTLIDYLRARHHFAEDGEKGGNSQLYGAGAEAKVLPVPLGTLIYDDETDELLGELVNEGERLTFEGGKGGLGNMHFRSSTNQTPRQFLPGEPGEERTLRLELKLLADVGLLGFPNAGKSTFLARSV
jgi:GTP-binding protein